MSAIDHIPNVDFLGDAVPFVDRIREIIEAIQLFEDFEPDDLEGLARGQLLACMEARRSRIR